MTSRPWGWGWLLAPLVAAATLGLVGLGVWQLGRLQQRRADNAVIAARLAQPPIEVDARTAAPPEFQRVRARGRYDFANEIVLRNRSHLESPGVHVITPLVLAGGDMAVLVDRGWIPYTYAAPPERAAFQTPAGEVVVEGIVRLGQQRRYAFLPGDPTQSAAQPRLDAWFWLDLAQIQMQMPYRLLPVYIEAAPGPDPARLPIAGYEVDLSDGPHLSYALQWFAFAAILAGGSVAVWRQRRLRQGAAAAPATRPH